MTLSSSPKTAQEWFVLGNQFAQDNRLSLALEAYRHSIKLAPNVSAPWMALAQVLTSNSQFEEARQCLLRAVGTDPQNPVARQQLASSHRRLGFVDEAKEQYEFALNISPQNNALRFSYGQLLEDIGEPEDAIKAYHQCIDSDPNFIEPLACLLGLGRHTSLSPLIALANTKIGNLGHRERALLGYGLGKALDQKQRYQAAFDAFKIANQARVSQYGQFNVEQFETRIAQLKAIFSSEFYEERKQWGHHSNQPIFIVGLPRSGTTLTEQILDAHSQCFGAGELDVLSDLVTGTPDRINDAKTMWPQTASLLEEKHIEAMSLEYLKRSTQRVVGNPKYVIDKQPLNFWHLGLIALMFPNAKIIHCTRDIRDCGLSIYMQNFNVQQRWATDLNHIVHYWRGQQTLMSHFKQTTGLTILNVPYEKLVDDTKTVTQNLLEALDVPWEHQVTQFYNQKRAVQTPSKWQVRQPIYRSSNEKWKRYESNIAPLLDIKTV